METLLQQLTQGNALLLIIILGFSGSFQIGYQNTGLSSPSPFIQGFINSTWYDRYGEPPSPQTVTMIWSLIVSLYAVGGLCGAISVKFITGTIGRKKAMICSSWIGIVAAVIVLMSKYAKSYEMIIVARILYGFAAGLVGSTHSMYLGEISPRRLRGIVAVTYPTFLSLGKLAGQFFGLSEILGREELWNVLLCVPSFFSLIQIIVLPFLPEAPRYLFIEKGEDEACKKALQSLWGKGDYKQEMEEMLAEQAVINAAPPKTPLQLIKDRTVRLQLIIILIIYFCNQMSGMSAITVFSFDIFLRAGIEKDMIRYVTLGLGLTEIVTYISCSLLIERTGRRVLFWVGYGLMSACWVIATVTLNLKDSSFWVPYVTFAVIILFIVFFCGGPSGSTPALINEIFIQSDRLAAFVLAGIQRWLLFAILGLAFPFIINGLDSYCFVLFAFICLAGCVFTFFLLPETKEKTLLEISNEFKAITICGKSFSGENLMETKL
ncbi:solute carrier family 2 member 9%2C like 1 [Xyrichtys novacula]|uniref:Solute carrier family 2, facilitated glucose transporter member 5 n=1 Tax=Xyrichtys novacula TaxID=13765 RepID=A0AAV1ES30_XYRNO|nr:solute carrier family 2 member 9%2C like 1 [Xyrichtys novacula]